MDNNLPDEVWLMREYSIYGGVHEIEHRDWSTEKKDGYTRYVKADDKKDYPHKTNSVTYWKNRYKILKSKYRKLQEMINDW